MLQETETSYFSEPSSTLDPRLFRNGKLDSSIRSAILQLLLNHLNANYTGADGWMTAWLTGSGVSYQWAANREPGDLDCQVAIDFTRFRASNNKFRGFSDKEIADEINEGFRQDLHPISELFLDTFELTFFAILNANIIESKPYAAYALLDDEWVVAPSLQGQQAIPEFDAFSNKDREAAINIMTKFIAARNKYDQATNDAVKANARSEMRIASSQAITLYEDIHGNRANAFGPNGKGYSDFANYRWQSGKKLGVVNALRAIKKEMEARDAEAQRSTYGVDLPDAATLIRRAATYNQ